MSHVLPLLVCSSMKISLGEKCPYLEFFWSVFSSIRTEYGPEKLRTRTLFTQRIIRTGVTRKKTP